MNTFFNEDEKQPLWKLTISEIKSFKGFEHISDEKAESIIDSLVQFARTINQINTTVEKT